MSEGLSRSDEAADTAELRPALERPTELRSVELRADEAGVAGPRDRADEETRLLTVDAGVRLSSLIPPSVPSSSLPSSTWVSALASTDRRSAKESAPSPFSESKRCERIEPFVAEEPEADARLSLVLWSSASQNWLSLSSP